MAVLVWDETTKRYYETGIDHGVLYPIDASGEYPLGVAWNGLISVTENPSGAEPTPMYADNIKYLNMISAEEFGCTIEAYTYPVEFEQCDGSGAGPIGVKIGQQDRKMFGLVYRTVRGNDVDGNAYGYRLHLIYGCLASPSEKAYGTINESPEAITFSWEVTTTPVVVGGAFKPTSCIIIDSKTADPAKLAALLLVLFGDAATSPNLPLPAEIITLMTP